MKAASSSSVVMPTSADYHKRSARLLSQILESEEERVRLDQKLRSLWTIDARLKHGQQTDDAESHLRRFNQDSEEAKQRQLQLFSDIQHAQQHLDRLRKDVEHIIRLKGDQTQYSQSAYSFPQPTGSATVAALVNKDVYDFDRVSAYETHGNRTDSTAPPSAVAALVNVFKPPPSSAASSHAQEDPSLSESTSSLLSRSNSTASRRLELQRAGLYFLLNYIEKALPETIDKTKFYRDDTPTLTQIRNIVDIANRQIQSALADLDPAATSSVILHRLASTVRRTTVHQCLLTEDILSLNVVDLSKDAVATLIPKDDRELWTRLIEHLARLLKYHVMTSQTLASKFADSLLPSKTLFLQEKARSLLQHIVEKLVGRQQSSSEDESSTARETTVGQLVKATPVSSWLNKMATGGGLDDDDETSTASTVTNKNVKSSAASTPRAKIERGDSDLDFYS